jgi:hypothetical protein
MSEDTEGPVVGNFMQADSVQDSMGAIFDKMQEEPAEDSDNSETTDESKAEEESAETSTPEEDTQDEDQEDVKEPEGEDNNAVDDEPKESSEQPTDKIPIGLSEEVKSNWADLPDYVREDLIKREKDVNTRFQKSAEFVKHSQAIRNIEAPYQAMMQTLGANSEQAYQDHLKTAYILNHGSMVQKANLIQSAIDTYGIQLASQESSSNDWEDAFGESPQTDPKIEQLTNQVNQLTNMLNGQQQANQNSQQANADSTIEAFRNDPAHKYFDDVNPLMQGIMQAGQAKTLEEAYEMATMAHPKVRTSVLAEQNSKNNISRRKEAKAKTAKAKSAESTNLKSKGGKVSISQGRESAKRGDMPDFSKTMASVYESMQDE